MCNTAREPTAESETNPGMLLASGLIAGGSLAGVIIAFIEFLPRQIKDAFDLAEPTEKFFGRVFGANGAIVQETWAMLLFPAMAVAEFLAREGRTEYREKI